MNQIILVLGLATVVAALTGLCYRLGFQHGLSCLLPWDLLEELARHKVICRGEDPARAMLELTAHLRLSHEESERLVKRITDREEKAA